MNDFVWTILITSCVLGLLCKVIHGICEMHHREDKWYSLENEDEQ